MTRAPNRSRSRVHATLRTDLQATRMCNMKTSLNALGCCVGCQPKSGGNDIARLASQAPAVNMLIVLSVRRTG